MADCIIHLRSASFQVCASLKTYLVVGWRLRSHGIGAGSWKVLFITFFIKGCRFRTLTPNVPILLHFFHDHLP